MTNSTSTFSYTTSTSSKSSKGKGKEKSSSSKGSSSRSKSSSYKSDPFAALSNRSGLDRFMHEPAYEAAWNPVGAASSKK